MNKNRLAEKYTDKELAASFVFRTKLSAAQKAKSDQILSIKRKKMNHTLTANELLLSQILQLKYQIEDYLDDTVYDARRSFGYFLKGYIQLLEKKNKEFATDISIAETELSQILNKHRKPSEKIMIRLELHSNKIIPAITWYKLLEKEKEHEILTNNDLRINEQEHVSNRICV